MLNVCSRVSARASIHAVIAVTVLWAITGVSCTQTRPVAGATRLGGHDSQQQPLKGANVRAPQEDQQWKLRRADGEDLNLFTALASCEDEVFLTDNQNRLLRFDRRGDGALTVVADEDDGLGRPMGLVADCSNRRLHVVNEGPHTVTTLDFTSGVVLKTYSYPRNLGATFSAHLAAPDQVYIAGIWNSDLKLAMLNSPWSVDHFYDRDLYLGASLSLTTGAVQRLLRPYDNRCIGAGACLATDLDSFPHSTQSGLPLRVASQAASERVGLYDRQDTLLRTISVASPMFRRNGEVLAPGTRAQARGPWMMQNSIIRRVFAFSDRVAVVHTQSESLARNVAGPDGQSAELGRLNVYVNLYTRAGMPLEQDIKLSDVPVGKDSSHLYVIEHGPTGPRSVAPSVTLLRIRIITPVGALASPHVQTQSIG